MLVASRQKRHHTRQKGFILQELQLAFLLLRRIPQEHEHINDQLRQRSHLRITSRWCYSVYHKQSHFKARLNLDDSFSTFVSVSERSQKTGVVLEPVLLKFDVFFVFAERSETGLKFVNQAQLADLLHYFGG